VPGRAWTRSSRLRHGNSGKVSAVSRPREVLVTPYRDGPLLVRGPARILDDQGHELDNRREAVALCRCGKSRLRPLCDGTHKRVGFRAGGTPASTPDGLRELGRVGLTLAP
jgi:CDGSH-type Zn-finger protein